MAKSRGLTHPWRSIGELPAGLLAKGRRKDKTTGSVFRDNTGFVYEFIPENGRLLMVPTDQFTHWKVMR